MRIVSLSKKVGEQLGQRSCAADLRAEIVALEHPIQLDFSGVKLISYSFAVEFFGKLVDLYGDEVFHDRVILKNLRPEGQALVQTVLKNHVQQVKSGVA